MLKPLPISQLPVHNKQQISHCVSSKSEFDRKHGRDEIGIHPKTGLYSNADVSMADGVVPNQGVDVCDAVEALGICIDDGFSSNFHGIADALSEH